MQRSPFFSPRRLFVVLTSFWVFLTAYCLGMASPSTSTCSADLIAGVNASHARLVLRATYELDATGQADTPEISLLISSNEGAADVELDQRPIILWIAANNSRSTSGPMGMKTVPKRPQSYKLFTLMASATILPPSAMRLFDERFSDVNAPLSCG
jgi:hypothetical protein